ncbi:MAG: glycosyltransferase family 2 protein [Candidatus Omnitrophica bacterium]|nr:glycosyltransferase family 2 protein [Candidatus Omnitrophota bacterium]
MSTLSVVMITQNVEDKVTTALESARFADEIVIVDAGSQDKTLHICRQYTDKIYYNDWPGTTTKQWNEAITKASCEWVLLLASDEQIGRDLREEIENILNSETNYAGYYVNMKNVYLGRWLKHSGVYPEEVSRLFRKGKGRYEEREHGAIIIDGELGKLNGHIVHYSYRSIADVMRKTDVYTTLEAKRLFEEGFVVKKRYLISKPWRVFKKTYFKLKGFRDGIQGFLFCMFSAIYRFVILAKVWELQNKEEIKKQIDVLIRENQ